MEYNAPLNAISPNEPYIDGNPEYGIEGSMVPASAIEAPQREIVAAIKAAGLTPSKKNQEQLAEAIRKIAKEQTTDTALKLENPRKINGVFFDGTKDITVEAKAKGGDADSLKGYDASAFLKYIGTISNDDWNKFTIAGRYTVTDARGQNRPQDIILNGVLDIIHDGTIGKQTFYSYDTHDIWSRNFNAHLWHNWNKIDAMTGHAPVGTIFPLALQWGAPKPDNSGYPKYIELTYKSEYNIGLIGGEVVESRPHSSNNNELDYGQITHYTALVNCPKSPFHDKFISLINSENRYLRAGTNLKYDDAIRNIESRLAGMDDQSGYIVNGAFYRHSDFNYDASSNRNKGGWVLGFNPSLIVPTADENRPKTQEMTYFMRIL